MKNNKNLEPRKDKLSKPLFYILIIVSIVFIIFMALVSFIFTGWGTNLFSEWREAFFREIRSESEYIISDKEENPTLIPEISENDEKDKTEIIEEESVYDPKFIKDYFPLKIIIPKIEVESIVNDGYDDETLKRGPGFISVTSLPGEEGRCAISGHRTLYGAPFKRVDELENGDLIYLETVSEELLVFIVTGQEIVNPTDVYVLNGTNKKELLLTTCHPKYSAEKRLIIYAELLEVPSFEIN